MITSQIEGSIRRAELMAWMVMKVAQEKRLNRRSGSRSTWTLAHCLTSRSSRLESARMSFARLKASPVDCSRLNSSVRLLLVSDTIRIMIVLEFFIIIPLLSVTFAILAKLYSERAAYIILSWIPVSILALAYLLSSSKWAGHLVWLAASVGLLLIIGGIAVTLRAFENGRPCFSLVIATCLSAMPLLLLIVGMFFSGYWWFVGRSLTTHWTGARVSLAFIVNLSVPALCARPVNSGVMRLPPICAIS